MVAQGQGGLLSPDLLIPPSLPSLRFGAATSDRIDSGNPTLLTDVDPGTICAWVYNTTTATNQRIWQKGSGSNSHIFRLTTSRFGVVIQRTTPLNVEATATNFAQYATNKWLFVVGTWNTSGANGDQRIYVGDLRIAPAEPSSYDIAQTVGSGTMATDAGTNFGIGNFIGTPTVSWVGSYAFFGMWKRQLSYGEILQQWSQWVTPGSHLSTMGAINYTLIGTSGSLVAFDYSGYGNHGLVTGAVLSGVPSPFHALLGGIRRN